LTSPSLLPYSSGANSREYIDYTPSSLSLPLFLPILPLHSPSTRGTSKRNGVSSSTVTATLLPELNVKYSQVAWCWGNSLRVCTPNGICIGSTTPEGVPVAAGLPEEANAIGDSRKKNDRDRSTLTTGYSLRVHSSKRSIPGKIWMPTNQI